VIPVKIKVEFRRTVDLPLWHSS